MTFEQYDIKKEIARDMAQILSLLEKMGYELTDWEQGYLTHMLVCKEKNNFKNSYEVR
ncbi:hypothetical protein [Thomasclavelia cocleata]|uniref:hypothetical protein n=1 Tax=Thomasclavelia cocleata TaxID=69824 RepID=UPI002630031C|nr:hypothetical protein [Thomasclavelia cocleata]